MKQSIENFLIADLIKITKTYFEGEPTKKIINFGKIIVKQDLKYGIDFHDAITHKKYSEYKWFFAQTSSKVITNKIPLSTYINALKDEVKDIEFLSNRINNIISTGLISKYDIRLILKYLNNKESFNKKRINFNFIGKIPEKLSLKKKEKVSSNTPILTSKKQNFNKALGIEEEIDKLIMTLAKDKCNPILVGPNGIGKSTIVNELSRRISKNEVPKFLKNKKIIELTSFITIDKRKEKLKKEFVILMEKLLKNELINLIEECLKNKYIIFIDDIDKIFTKDNEITNLVKFYIKEKNLKVIGTTTSHDKYKFYIDDGDLYRNFTSILINEPTGEKLYEIIRQIFNNYSKKNNIKLNENMDLIIKELVELTKIENRITNDNLYKSEKEEIYNPDLVVRIIDNIFAHAKVNNNKALDYKDFEFGIDSCIYIKLEAKSIAGLAIKTIFMPHQKKLIKTHISRDIDN